MKSLLIALLGAALVSAAPNTSSLFEAVDRNDGAAVRALLDESPDLLEARGALNMTPLLKASAEGKADAARVLIELGANLEAGDNENSTPLTNAAAGGHIEIVRMLLAAGASVHARDDNGMTPTLFAAYRGQGEVLRMLIDAGGKVTDTTNAGSTALHGAATYGHPEVIPQLIAAGIDVNKKNTHGYTPLLAAVSGGNREAVNLLLTAGANVRAVNAGGEGAMHFAVRSPDTLLAADLLAAGAPIDPLGEGGNTPLAYAVRLSNPRMVLFLLAHGADPSITNGDGVTPILSAAVHGVWEMFPVLLMVDDKPDQCEPHFRRTLLHLAAIQGRRMATEALIARGANVNARDKNGCTPADLAARYGNKDVWDCLKRAGAKSTERKPQFGKCPVLNANYASGEAAFWYLGNCGWAVKTANKLLVFDYIDRGTMSSNPCLSNGRLCAEQLADFDVYIFVTHEHPDHFDSTIFPLASQLPHVTYIYGFDPDEVRAPNEPKYAGPAFTLMRPHDAKEFDGMRVSTIDANDGGVGYYVEVDGLTLYHAGDHAGWREGERDGFVNEIDWLDQRSNHLDVAFVNVTGCHVHDAASLEAGNLYTIEKLSPTVVVPTHGLNMEYVYDVAARSIHAAYPTVQIPQPTCRGDRFVYRNGKVAM